MEKDTRNILIGFLVNLQSELAKPDMTKEKLIPALESYVQEYTKLNTSRIGLGRMMDMNVRRIDEFANEIINDEGDYDENKKLLTDYVDTVVKAINAAPKGGRRKTRRRSKRSSTRRRRAYV